MENFLPVQWCKLLLASVMYVAPDTCIAFVAQGNTKKFVGVVQPSENSFAVAIVVDASCSILSQQQHSISSNNVQDRHDNV